MPEKKPEIEELLKRLDELFEDPAFWENFRKTMNEADKLAKELGARSRFPQPDPLTELFPKLRPPKFRQARLCRA
ncbi:MAG: hypothetical protein WD970_00360 [Patescibacteria group bacterium]